MELYESKGTSISCAFIREAALAYCTPHEVRAIDKRLGRLLREAGVKRRQVRGGEKRGHVYDFPALGELREAVERVMRVSATDPAA